MRQSLYVCSLKIPGIEISGNVSSLMGQILVAQRLSRFQRVLNSFLRFLLAAKRFEGLAFEIEDELLADRSSRCYIPAAEHLRNLCAELDLILSDEVSLAHEMHSHFQCGQQTFAGSRNVGARHGRLVSGSRQLQSPRLGVGK